MTKMLKYINQIKEKPEKIRKQYVSIALVICMTVVGIVWVAGISYRISSYNKTKEVAKVDKENESEKTEKPFNVLSTAVNDAYKNVAASVGDASVSIKNLKNYKEESKKDNNEKVIDLIPVEYTQ